jgi:hypothetical protein
VAAVRRAAQLRAEQIQAVAVVVVKQAAAVLTAVQAL